MSETLIKVEGLSKKFCSSLKRSMFYGTTDVMRDMIGLPYKVKKLRKKEFWALQDINFELKRGETLGLIGQNGCGKTTLLRLLNGIFPPDKGKISIKGRVGALIAVGAGFHPHMTGRENVFLNGSILGMSKVELKRKFDEIVDFAEIGKFIDSPVAMYSSGMRVRLGFAIAIHCEPDVLLIDEILAVGDLGFRVKCINKIQEIRQSVAVLFVSHAMTQITSICTNILLMEKGTVEYNGNDVGLGIEKYYNKFDTAESSIIGEGKATLNGAKFEYNGQTITDDLKITSGDIIKIILDLNIIPEIENISIRLGIFNSEYRLIAEIDSLQENFSIKNTEEGNVIVSTEIQSLYLRYGKYTIDLHIMDIDNKEKILRQSTIASFVVKYTLTVGADFLLPSKWQ